MKRFVGKTVLITGAAQGQGESHARGFAAEGANVVLADVQADKASALADKLGSAALFIELDVGSASDWDHAIKETERRFGAISVLINNAGILVPSAPIAQSDPADWDRVLNTNLKGSYLGIRASTPSLKRAGGGSIINIASTSGHVGTPMLAAYVSSKWAIRGLTRTAATELARDRIRVNSISPGVIETPLITQPLRAGEVAVSDHFSPETFAIPRMGEPSEVTRLIKFLASNDAAFITGADYVIDGGLLLGPVASAQQE